MNIEWAKESGRSNRRGIFSARFTFISRNKIPNFFVLLFFTSSKDILVPTRTIHSLQIEVVWSATVAADRDTSLGKESTRIRRLTP